MYRRVWTYQSTIDGDSFFSPVPSCPSPLEPLRASQVYKVELGSKLLPVHYFPRGRRMTDGWVTFWTLARWVLVFMRLSKPVCVSGVCVQVCTCVHVVHVCECVIVSHVQVVCECVIVSCSHTSHYYCRRLLIIIINNYISAAVCIKPMSSFLAGPPP